MHNDDARRFGVKDGERVIVEVDGPRGADLKNVLVRVKDSFRLEMHIDTDEANALGIGPGATVTLRREQEA
jgi:putative phosphotransacetylase